MRRAPISSTLMRFGSSIIDRRVLSIFVRRVACFCAVALSLAAADPVETVRSYRQSREAQLISSFVDLLSLENTTGDLPNLRRNAKYLVEQFSARGIRTRLLEQTDAAPVVYGEILTPGATRSIGVYVHYDAQPTDPTRWVTEGPWKPALYDARHDDGGRQIPFPDVGDAVNPEWRLYGRASGDDKAPLLAWLTAIDALRDAEIAITSNFKFLFDGEEERGSPNLHRYLDRDRALFEDIDLWLFCDGPVHASRQPQLVFGVRGIASMEITVYGANRPLHSGHYGNWAPVPGTHLARLLSSMKDDTGRVLVEGFYGSVEPIGGAELEALAALPVVDNELRRELGLAGTEANNALLAERLTLPSLTIRGLSSGDTGAKARNIIPPTATANLGIRLVKGNDPAQMLGLIEQHIRKMGFHIVSEDPDDATRLRYPKIAKVVRGRGTPAARTAMNLPIAGEIVAAVERSIDGPLLKVPTMGGTLPVYLFTEGLGQPVLILPIANHDNNQHAANENLRLANLWYGIDVFASILTMP